MNIKDFLIDNYIWIIVVILLIIITIIGFLADKKKVKEPKNGAPVPNNLPPSNMNGNGQAAPMNYQPVTNQIDGNVQNNQNQALGQLPNSTVAPVNVVNQPNDNNIMNSNINPVVANANNPLGNVSTVAPTPVEPINNSVVNPEPMYQPLSEQKPSFSATNMNSPLVSNQTSVTPVPVSNNENVINNQPVQAEPMANSIPSPIPNVIPNQMPGSVNVNPVPIPTPTSPIPVPQPLPNANDVNNSVANLNNNTIPNTVPTPQPINFVYGQQNNQNNNGMM